MPSYFSAAVWALFNPQPCSPPSVFVVSSPPLPCTGTAAAATLGIRLQAAVEFPRHTNIKSADKKLAQYSDVVMKVMEQLCIDGICLAKPGIISLQQLSLL